MAQKDKIKKSKENLAKKEGKDKKSSGKCGFSCKTFLLATTLLAALSAVAVRHVFTTITNVPDLPELDLNYWWGPNTTEKQDTSIRPFRIVFSDAMTEHLRKRFDVYRAITSRKKSITESFEYGTNSDALAQVFAHWQFKYSFREREKFLNKFDHFKTNIQGLNIHFVHVKPKTQKDVKVLPLLLLHGWPGSFREFYDVIPLLTNPRPGYDFVFEVIVPSLPGFTYSQGTTKPGLSPLHVAVIMRNLMHRLGFKQYYVQGGDFGHTIGTHMATVFPQEVLGFHTNLPANFSKLALLTWLFGGIWPSLIGKGLEDRMYPVKDKVEFFLEEFGYMHLQGTKPDTIANSYFFKGTTKPGLSPLHVAVIMRNLMHRLGFKQYYVQGGDFGHTIGTHMATVFPQEVLGFHTNLPANFSKLALLTWLFGGIWPSLIGKGLEDRMYPVKDKVEFFLEEFGYMHLQGTKPDTIGIALTDSPIGLASYILDKFLIFSNPENKYHHDGGLSKINISDFLDNIMLYWTTSCITTSLRLYKESFLVDDEQTMINIPATVPTWGLRLRHELVPQPDFILRWKYPNLTGTTTLDVGGHFAAFERPKELADDVFLAVKSFLNK